MGPEATQAFEGEAGPSDLPDLKPRVLASTIQMGPWGNLAFRRQGAGCEPPKPGPSGDLTVSKKICLGHEEAHQAPSGLRMEDIWPLGSSRIEAQSYTISQSGDPWVGVDKKMVLV